MNLERRTTNLDGLDEINKKASNSSINLCREKSYSLAIFDPIILPADYHQKNSDSISLDMTNVSDAQYKKKKPVNKSSSLALHSTRRTIHQVARDGDVDGMKKLLECEEGNKRNKINELNADHLSPLHYAARYNHYTMVKLIVEKGSMVNIRGEDGVTPLHLVARYKKTKQPKLQRQYQTETNDYSPPVKRCLERYSSGYVSDSSVSISGETPDSIVHYLVSQNADVNCKDDHGLTPLHYASMRGNDVATRDLLQCTGINIEARDSEDATPLHLAAVHGKKEIARLLISVGANVRCRDKNFATPLHCAAREGNYEIVKMLIESAERRGGSQAVSEILDDKDNEKNEPLHLAVENGYEEIVQYLIAKGACVNVPRGNFAYPLHLAAISGNVEIVEKLLEYSERVDFLNIKQGTPLHRAAEFNHVMVIKLLIKHNANLEHRDKDNFTALLISASHGHVEAIQCLLEHGADINAMDKDDKTAVYWAAQQNKYDALMVLLQDARSRYIINRQDRYGNSPLHVAALKGYCMITQALLDYGAQIDLKNEEEQMPLHLAAMFGRTKVILELIRHNKQIINGEDEDGNTSLHLAALAGHENVLKILSEVGANVEARNSRLWTPLECAASKGWIRCVRVLLDANCPIDSMDRAKTTPLHLAALTGSVEVCLLLLDSGSDVTRRDDQGRNCLELAIETSQKEVSMAIIQSKYWLEALSCESFTEDGLRVTPLRLLIKKMPDAQSWLHIFIEVAEAVFNRFMHTNDLPSNHPLYTVTFNYELLDDTYVNFIRESSSVNTFSYIESSVPYSQNSNVIKENHPLMLMVRCRRQKLLAHPFCISLIHLKWVNFGRYVYYANLFSYLFFLAFLTGFLLTVPTPPVEYVGNKSSKTSVIALNESSNARSISLLCSDIHPNEKILRITVYTLFSKYAVIILSSFHLSREVFQMHMLRLHYLNLENFLEWICYVTSLLLVIDFTECAADTGLRQGWQWEVGSIAIFLGWMNLILFIRKLPYFGIYVVMLVDVLMTFCKVCVVFFFFIIAFALGFHTVMYYEDQFSTAGKSIARSTVMMLGEIVFDNFFKDGHLRYPIPTYFFFISFIGLVCLIIMNLLVGLAVDDIKSVKEQANLKRLAMQVELVLSVESLLPKFLQQRFIVKEKSFLPNRTKASFWEKILSYCHATQTIRDALMAQDKTDLEKIQEHQENTTDKLSALVLEFQKSRRQTEKLHTMIQALAHCQGTKLGELTSSESPEMNYNNLI